MTHAPRIVNGTTKRTCKCAACGAAIPAGERVHMMRERALSHAHACHAGTLYPWRIECRACAESWSATFATPVPAPSAPHTPRSQP